MHEERLVKNIVEQILTAAKNAEASQILTIDLAVHDAGEYATHHLKDHLERHLVGTIGEHAKIRFLPVTDPSIECSPIGLMLKSIEVAS